MYSTIDARYNGNMAKMYQLRINSKREAFSLATLSRQKNIAAKILIILTLWVSVSAYVWFISPDAEYAVEGLLGLVFIALAYTTSIVIKSAFWGFVCAFIIILFLYARTLGVGDLSLFLGIIGAIFLLVYLLRH